MYISYLGNLNLHIDTCMKLYFLLYQPFEEKYNCSSSSLSCALSPSLFLSLFLSLTHTPLVSFSQTSLARISQPRFLFCTAFTFHPMSKCSWPFTPDLSPHFLVILLTLSFRRCATYFYIKFITFRLIFSRVLYTVQLNKEAL